MSTRTQRQSSLSSLSEAKQIVDGIPLGQVDPEQVVQVARRVYEGGGVQRRFQELCISGAPYTSFPSEGDGPQTVRQVTALLGHLDTIDISSLKPSACGCFIPAAPGSLITFCKGSCDLDEDDDVSKCVECGTGRCLWFTPEFCEQICRQQQKLAGNRRRRHPKHRPRTQAPRRRLQSSGSAQRNPTPT